MSNREEGERCFVVNCSIISLPHFSDIILVVVGSGGGGGGGGDSSGGGITTT